MSNTFYEKHPDLTDKKLGFHCTKYSKLDEDGNPIEEWEDVNGKMVDFTEINKLKKEIKALKKEVGE